MFCVIFFGVSYQQSNYSFKSPQYTASIINAASPPETKTPGSLSVEQKIAQLFMVGIDSQNTKEAEQFVQQNLTGGIILLTKNFQNENQTRDLINKLQSASREGVGVPLFISVDQEGGGVSRVPFSDVESTSQTETISPAQAYAIAKQRGEELKNLGITMNFAPVLDVITNPKSFLYNRVFPGNVQKISELGLLSAQGYRDAGILSCAKHFPGHGDALTDPHNTTSINNQTTQEIKNNIQSFSQVIGTGIPCIMVGHVIDSVISPLPASQSPEIINLLRDQEHFNGIIITDDMEMAAARFDSMVGSGRARPNQTIAQASLSALQAGADMVLISGYTTTQQQREQIIREVTQKIIAGALTQKQLDEKISRILRIKNSL